MVKAVFLDYSGTAVNIVGEDMKKMVRIITEALHGKADPKELIGFWFARLREYENNCFGEAYEDEDALVYRVLEEVHEHYGLETDYDVLHDLNQHIWRTARLFDDTKPFFEQSDKPIYVLTNNTASYVMANLENRGVTPAGVISADDVRAFKPHHEIFDEALKRAGCRPEEAIHIGDSLEGDVIGALKAGIPAVLLDRKGKVAEGTYSIEIEGKTYSYKAVQTLLHVRTDS
jgi:HAD superfamily hydrolase (TIGR01549 family)